MLKNLLLLVIVAVLWSPVCLTMPENSSASEETVYVCTGAYATRYHRVKDCRGLNNCRGKVKTISISQALKEGRTPCEICYRRQY